MAGADLGYVAEEIKRQVSCRTFAEAVMGLKLDPRGLARCPFHSEKTASFKVYGDGRGWTCFGCHKGGDVINLARDFYGVSFPEAIRQIDADLGLHLIESADRRTAEDVGPMRRLLMKQKQKELDDQIETAWSEWEVLYDEWLQWDALRRTLEPRRNGGELYKGYAIALRNTQRAEYNLDKAEERRHKLCRERRQAATP